MRTPSSGPAEPFETDKRGTPSSGKQCPPDRGCRPHRRRVRPGLGDWGIPGHPIGLFRAKHTAEEMLLASGIPWTIVRAAVFMETWGKIMAQPLQASGKSSYPRGDNPVNFVPATDVAALVSQTATGPSLRGQILELGGPGNLTFNQVAAILQETTGRRGAVRHIPRPALHTMAIATARLKPALARQARAALAMDTIDMTFDPAPTRRGFPDLPNTGLPSALKELLA